VCQCVKQLYLIQFCFIALFRTCKLASINLSASRSALLCVCVVLVNPMLWGYNVPTKCQYQKSWTLWKDFLDPMRKAVYKSCEGCVFGEFREYKIQFAQYKNNYVYGKSPQNIETQHVCVQGHLCISSVRSSPSELLMMQCLSMAPRCL